MSEQDIETETAEAIRAELEAMDFPEDEIEHLLEDAGY